MLIISLITAEKQWIFFRVKIPSLNAIQEDFLYTVTNQNARPWRHNRYVYPLPECYVLTDTTQCTTRVRRDSARSKQCWILIYFRLEKFSTTFENFISFSKYFKYDLDYPLLVLAQCLIVVQNYCKKLWKETLIASLITVI